MDRTTTMLAEFAAAPPALGDAALHAVKRRLIDSVGCAMGGLSAPVCRTLRALASATPGQRGAVVWGTAGRGAPEMAAFANGAAIRFLDQSDTYVSRSPGHPSDLIAGVLATADAAAASGAVALAGIAVGYDVYCAFLDAAVTHEAGIDQATAAALGSAAGCGHVLGLSATQMGHALSLAIASNLHLNAVRHGELSDWKGCAGPHGGRAGVFAATLAAHGLTGPADPFEGPGGLAAITGPMQWRLPDTGPRQVEQTDIKSFPACYHGLSAIEAAIALHPRCPVDKIRAIEIDTYRLAIARMAGAPSRWTPGTRGTADHSLPFVVAAALRDGGLGAAAYDTAQWNDPALRRLMALVAAREDSGMSAAYPEAAPARVTVTLHSGAQESAEVHLPLGHANRPLSDTQLDAKFHDLAAACLQRAMADRLLSRLWAFDTMKFAAALFDDIHYELEA
jgi:2-methylcitrate dehydratase